MLMYQNLVNNLNGISLKSNPTELVYLLGPVFFSCFTEFYYSMYFFHSIIFLLKKQCKLKKSKHKQLKCVVIFFNNPFSNYMLEISNFTWSKLKIECFQSSDLCSKNFGSSKNDFWSRDQTFDQVNFDLSTISHYNL